jgi:hypothetical protein
VAITIAIFKKLLVTNIVASNLWGWSNSLIAWRLVVESFDTSSLISLAFREKYAVSAPAVIAVSNSNMVIIINRMVT